MDSIQRRRTLPPISRIIALGIVAALVFFAVKTFLWGTKFMNETGVTPILAARLIFDDGSQLKSSQNRTNILILGVGGGTHEGADLTDTMMVLSLNNATKTMAFISVPRDIWSDDLKDRVNSAYHYGEQKKKGGGLLLAKVIAEDVIGISIHYAMVIDFSGFENVIDEVGGIDVNVPLAFTDTQYPKPGMEKETCPGDPTNACVYEVVHFDSGLQHMDGARALIYARSRHAEGDEGSDFARSRRQQEIMVALKNRMVHPFEWFTAGRLKSLPSVIDDATDMDMNIATVMTIGKRFVDTRESDIKKISIDDMLETPPSYVYGRYVLVPKEDWETIHVYIKQQLQ